MRSTRSIAMLAAAGAMIASASATMLQPARNSLSVLRPEPPRIAAPAYAIKSDRLNRKLAERKRRKARRRMEAAERHRPGRQKSSAQSALQRVLNAMTNHERHCWSRHCGNDRTKRKDIEIAKQFLNPLGQVMSARSGTPVTRRGVTIEVRSAS